ncbi:MAG: hypothetical protein R3B38_00750 [Patescibacteria group bacterium]
MEKIDLSKDNLIVDFRDWMLQGGVPLALSKSKNGCLYSIQACLTRDYDKIGLDSIDLDKFAVIGIYSSDEATIHEELQAYVTWLMENIGFGTRIRPIQDTQAVAPEGRPRIVAATYVTALYGPRDEEHQGYISMLEYRQSTLGGWWVRLLANSYNEGGLASEF